jgi:hypothetical protein
MVHYRVAGLLRQRERDASQGVVVGFEGAIESERKTQQLIKEIVCVPSLLSWLQVSELDLHQERSTKNSSSANTDIVPDNE